MDLHGKLYDLCRLFEWAFENAGVPKRMFTVWQTLGSQLKVRCRMFCV